MELKEIFTQIFSTLFVFKDNTHNLHVNCKGTGTIAYHPFLGEIYQWADGKLDWIMERAKFHQIDVPTQYAEIQIASKILQQPIVETNIEMIKQIMKNDMDYMETYLKVWESSSLLLDTVLNTKIIDYREELGVFIYKNNQELGV